jgi:hypothetical protein
MVNFVPTWRIEEVMTQQDPMSAYTVGTYPNYVAGTALVPQFEEAIDPILGMGEFVYAQANGTISQFNAVEFNASSVAIGGGLSQVCLLQATTWAGTANSGKALGFAMAAYTTGQYGWFQVKGFALATTNGTATAGSPVFWQAAGVVSSTGAASKQMLNAVVALATGTTLGNSVQGVVPVVGANQAVIYIMEPQAQGAIT